MKTVLVPIANGTEELEAIAITDILRRAEADVTVASVEEKTITASRNTSINADTTIDQCAGNTYDLIVLPGGIPGVNALSASDTLKDLLLKQAADDKLYAAICAAPAAVLDPIGLLEGRAATGYPTSEFKCTERLNERVVVSGNCITSQGAGTAVEFALALVEALYDKETADSISSAICA